MEKEKKSTSTHHNSKSNVGNLERGISALAGTYFVYCGLAKENKSVIKTLLGGFLLYRGLSGNCPAYTAIGKKSTVHKPENINIKTTISINKPRAEVYEFWHRLENLPLFMKHLKNVSSLDDKTSEWEAKIPGGIGTFKWKSEIVKDIPNEHIGWHSLPGSAIENAGNIKFSDAGKFGTEVHVVISYHAPGGIAGEGIGRLLNPAFEKMIREDIKNLKRYLETGEIPSIEGQPKGKG